MTTTLEDLWEVPADDEVPPLDRDQVGHLDGLQTQWRNDGIVYVPGFIPSALVDAYVEDFEPWMGLKTTPYLDVRSMANIVLYRPLVDLLGHLVGEEMAVHLILARWTSSERDWHQDDYLNPPWVNSWYAAVWIALEDIDPNSGPFQYVPGSNRWPVVRRSKVLQALGEDGSDPDWPWRSEKLLSPLYEAEMDVRGVEPVTYVPAKGDLLVWHGRTVHRGSKPKVPGSTRRALIAHYSGVNHRRDMPALGRHPDGGRFFIP